MGVDVTDQRLDALFRDRYVPLLRLAAIVTRSPALAEDLVNEAFVKLVQHWLKVSGHDHRACGDIMARMARSEDVLIDRQGRLVVPRSMRDILGEVPGTVRAREVDGGVLLEPMPIERDEWWANLHRELDALTDTQVIALAEDAGLFEGTAGDGLGNM